MGNINEPFMASNRFEVAFTSTPPRYRLELTIVGIRRRPTYLLIYLCGSWSLRLVGLTDTSSSVILRYTTTVRCRKTATLSASAVLTLSMWQACNCNCNCNWGTCIAPPHPRRPRAHYRVNPYLGQQPGLVQRLPETASKRLEEAVTVYFYVNKSVASSSKIISVHNAAVVIYGTGANGVLLPQKVAVTSK